MPPSPPHDAFAREKPANGFRVFVLGESATAGFPYPHNGTFSRILRDALHDVLPADSVEVVNLGIPATNSYQMLDLVDEVIAEHPDAVLIYAGHNEYYGALGVGSTVRVASSPALVRMYLRAMHWRVPALLNAAVAALRRRVSPPPTGDVAVASFMETVVADQDIRTGSLRLHAGERQFEGNMVRLLARLRAAGVPTFVGVARVERARPAAVCRRRKRRARRRDGRVARRTGSAGARRLGGCPRATPVGARTRRRSLPCAGQLQRHHPAHGVRARGHLRAGGRVVRGRVARQPAGTRTAARARPPQPGGRHTAGAGVLRGTRAIPFPRPHGARAVARTVERVRGTDGALAV